MEAGTRVGWAGWVGPAGRAVGLDHFGASAPAEHLFEKFGLTEEVVAGQVEALLESRRPSGASV